MSRDHAALLILDQLVYVDHGSVFRSNAGFCIVPDDCGFQPAAAGGYRIAGTVVSKSDGHPLDHAGVAVVDVKNRKNFQVVITSGDGRFLFQGLTAGKYSLEGRRKGYISAAYDSHEQYATAIVTGADLDTEHLVLRLAPDGLIAGKVLDESGEPVRHATVTVYFEDHSSGIGQVQPFRGAQTDDEGEYEVTPLMPGTYFVSASATPWYAVHPSAQLEIPGAPPVSVDRSLDVTYPLTYYGDETEADNASPIPIRGGERVTADIHLSPAPALTLRFRVPENAPNGFQVPQLQQTGFDGSITSVQTSGLRMVSPGVMEITGIPAGKYNVRINGEGSAAQMSGLDLNREGQEVDLSTAAALSDVKISVNIPGGAEMPHRGEVALRSGRRVLVAWQQVSPKGEAELQQVPAGVYDVLAWNFGKPYSIDRVAVDGAQVRNTVPLNGSGQATYSNSTLAAGRYTVTATYLGNATASGSIANLGQLIIGNAARITVSSGTYQTAVEGSPFAMPLVVLVQDARGLPGNPSLGKEKNICLVQNSIAVD